ncbi:MAG: RlmE family RNA methyltransferase [Candidatus Lokiarchaeota archaeon]|nr:RlmE family RNA methyltransferase [Candidatus Lokiarchaeota archaeon]
MVNNRESHKKEQYYKQAKKEGFRARSAYKLFDIQKRFNIFKRAFYILDIGCAPGSWLQVVKKYTEENLVKYNDQYYHRDHYKIMGIDIEKTSPIENVNIIKADITKPEIQTKINSFFQGKLDLVLSDASIKKTGNKFTDHLRQITLCYKILELARNNLKFKGNLVIKAFQGSDFNKFYKEVNPIFRILKSYKPMSSKKKSNEIFLIGLQKRN